jgi:hypothetical protein
MSVGVGTLHILMELARMLDILAVRAGILHTNLARATYLAIRN